MTNEAIIAQIRGIEAQLAILRAQLERQRPAASPSSLGDLSGLLAEHGDFSEEEIDAALYQFEWGKEESLETSG